MPIVVAPQYIGIPHINREFKGWEVYVHGGQGYGMFSTKEDAKQKAKQVRKKYYDSDVRIRVLNKNGGEKYL